MQIFKEDGGKTSSRRVMGVYLIVLLSVILAYKEYNNSKIDNSEVFITMFIGSGTLLGLSFFKENFEK